MAIQKIQIALVDLVATAGSTPNINHVDFMSLSAHNPDVVKGKIERLTAKIERIKAKPKTEARTRRMAAVKKRVGELKTILKDAIKAEKTAGKAKRAEKRVDAKLSRESRRGRHVKNERLLKSRIKAEKKLADLIGDDPKAAALHKKVQSALRKADKLEESATNAAGRKLAASARDAYLKANGKFADHINAREKPSSKKKKATA